MARDEYEENGSGCFGTLLRLMVFLVIAGVGAAVYFASQPQDLSNLKYAAEKAQARNLTGQLENSLKEGYALTLDEADLNRTIHDSLTLNQGGELAEWVTLKGVWVRIDENLAELIVEREVAGYDFTSSMFLQIEQVESASGISTEVYLHGGPYHESIPMLTRGGRLGKLVVPQGFLVLLMPEFRKLAAVFEQELNLSFQQMARMQMSEGALVLDPNAPTKEVDGSASPF